MSKDFKGLTDVEVISGTAQDPDGSFRGFVTIRALADDGSFLTGQLDPDEVRAMALRFLEVAEAADQDRIVFHMLVHDIGLGTDQAAAFVMNMREQRS
jgi:hypothetical protein